MKNHINKHSRTKAGSPVIRPNHRSFVFDKNPADALAELNQVILHLKRLTDLFEGSTHSLIEGTYNISCRDFLGGLKELRDCEFGDCVNWNTISKALRAEK